MKKLFKKSLSLFLCTVMAFSCCAVLGSAATKDTVFQYGETGGYLAIGDSIGKGCGSAGSYIRSDGSIITEVKDCGGQYNDWGCRYVEGCYAAQVADAVGCKNVKDRMDVQGSNFWPCTFGGMTTAVANDLYGFDDNYSDTTLGYYYYDEVLKYFGYEGSDDGANLVKYEQENPDHAEDDPAYLDLLDERYTDAKEEGTDEPKCGKSGNIIEVTKEASLITIELGMCDIFYRAYRVITDGGMLGDGLDIDFTDVDTLKTILTSAVDLLNDGYDCWYREYPILLEGIKKLNPNATIVMVGSFNVVDQMTLLDQTMFPLGSLFSTFDEKMNEQYEKWAEEYDVLYADISNCEALCTQEDWSLLGKFMDGNSSFAGTHPSLEGYDYITRQILSVLPTQEEQEQVDTGNDIIADLVRFNSDNVKAVYVNGIKRDFSFDGNTITVPFKTSLATSMVIKTVNDDGSTGFQFYTLSHKDGGGYTVSRKYGHNDTNELLYRPIALMLFLFELIKGLFQ